MKSTSEKLDGLISKWPGKIPIVVIDKDNIFHKTKFLIPESYTVGMFMAVLRNYTEINKSQALYLFFDNILPSTNSTIGEMYETYKSSDNVVYTTVTLENTFG